MQHPTLMQYLVITQAVQSLKARESAKLLRVESRTQIEAVENLSPSCPDHSDASPAIPGATPSPIAEQSGFYTTITSEMTYNTASEPIQTPRGAQPTWPDQQHSSASSPVIAQPPSSLLYLAPLFVTSSPPIQPIQPQPIAFAHGHSILAAPQLMQTSEEVYKYELPKVVPAPPRSPVPYPFVSCKSTMDSSPIIVPQVLHIPLSPQSPR